MTKRILFGLLGALTAAACGGAGNNQLFTGGSGTTTPTGTGTTTGSDGGTGGTSTGGGCKSDAQCSDGFDCTVDTCTDGVCSHAVGPGTGPTACPAGSFCEVHTGCVESTACATTDQCLAKLGGDACKVAINCDPSLAICTYATLDKDGDGHPPVVCGGDDCDDNDGTRYPGRPEACDGKDNDCDGTTDEGATCPGGATCENGACACDEGAKCGGVCVDKLTDPKNCGTCGNACSSGATCVGGDCKCAAGASMCNGDCVDTKTDAEHCGDCITSCGPGGVCQNGTCGCLGGLILCNKTCVDPKTDPNNCNKCNTTCSSCENGVCKNCPTPDLFVMQDQSGSMDDPLPGAGSRYQVAQQALTSFVTSPMSAGLGVGLGYFPLPASGTAPTTCTVDADCGAFGPCFFNMCLGGVGADSCTAADYAVPSVAIAPLPGSAAAITSSLSMHGPSGSSAQAVGLQGALTYAKSFATANPSHKVAVVLISDGFPNVCTQNSGLANDTVAAAQPFAMGTPPVKTFVISVGTDHPTTEWDKIAIAGGTTKSYSATSPATLSAALDAVRTAWMSCQ